MAMDQGTAGLLGVVLGAALSSGGAVCRRYAKRRRYETAIGLEFRRAVRLIDAKLSWLRRPLPSSVVQAVPDRMVRVDGATLFLGEEEKFTLPLPFWRTNFHEIVSLLPSGSFSSLAAAAESIEMFESKFCEMKLAFRGTVGNPAEMAAACYKDLLSIRKRLGPIPGIPPAGPGN